MSNIQDVSRKDIEASDSPAIEHIWTAMQKSRVVQGPMRHPEPAAAPPRTPPDGLWSSLRVRTVNSHRVAQSRVVTAGRVDPAQGAFDMLRTRVLGKLRENNWNSIAITSPTHGCGKSVVASNLAFSLANQKECRTVLVDLNLRQPGIGEVLDVATTPPIEEFLRGRTDLERYFVRVGDNLAIVANSRPVTLAAELLQSAETATALREMRRRLMPNVVIYDLPPMLAYDDTIAFLPNVDCVILVVEAEASMLAEVDACEHELSLRTNVLGVVLNKCRHVDAATLHRDGA